MCLLHVGSVGDVDVACNNAALTWLANIKKHLKDGSTGPVVFKLSRCDGKTKKSRKKKTGAQQMTSRITPLGIVESPTPDAFARKTCGLLAGIGGINYTRRVKFMELAMPKGKWKNMSTLVKRMIQSTSESMLEDTAIVCLIVRREEPHTVAKQTEAVDLSSLYKNKPKPVLLAAVSTATCGSAFVALCKHNDRWWLKTNREVRCLHLKFFPRPHPFSDSRRISSQNVENFPPKLEFQAARGLGTHPWLESSCLTRFPGRPLDYKKSTNRILRFNWLKSLSKKVTDSKIIVRPKIKPVFKKTASSPFLAS